MQALCLLVGRNNHRMLVLDTFLRDHLEVENGI